MDSHSGNTRTTWWTSPPALAQITSHQRVVYSVSFAYLPSASGGAFYNYAAPYVAVCQDDRVILRQSMFPEKHSLVRGNKILRCRQIILPADARGLAN